MAAFFLPKSHRKFETARQLRKYSGNLRKISCGAVLLKTVEIVAANPLIQRRDLSSKRQITAMTASRMNLLEPFKIKFHALLCISSEDQPFHHSFKSYRIYLNLIKARICN